jgi:teichuronic acid biosynthesis glycosyltransferase TuaC
MKVLVFTTVYPSPAQPTHGVFVRERVRQLAERADVRVVAPVPWHRTGKGGVTHRGVWHPRFFYIPGLFKCLDGVFLFLSALATVRRLQREFDFDVIDAHFTFPDGFAAILLARWFKRPVTITVRGTLIPLCRYRLRRIAMGWTLRRADRVIAVAHLLADRARAFGVPADRIAVIPNGVDLVRFAPASRAEARRALDVADDATLLVSVGHLSPRKGFQRVIATLPRLLERYPRLQFTIVGGVGAERDNARELRRLIESERLDDRVSMIGPQSPDRVALWLQACDLFVLASDYEGCPNVVWEALACGRPVVVTRVGEVDRMVTADAGLVIDDPEDLASLGDAIAAALERQWDVDVVRGVAEPHTWGRVADRVLAEWRLACGSGELSPSPQLQGFQP